MVNEKIVVLIFFINAVFCGKLYFTPNNEQRCADGVTTCLFNQTCCRNAKNEYGCCGFKNGVCCESKLHCCPENFECTENGCFKERHVISTETPNHIEEPKENLCPDHKKACSIDETCCPLSNGEYGCCPLPEAVCCSDHEHCCPSDSVCDPSGKACVRQDGLMIKWSKKHAARELSSVMCPDQKSVCPNGSTCCLLTSGLYGCCPTLHAVCCKDHVHCCPEGYICGEGSCTKSSDESIPLLKKFESQSLNLDTIEKRVLCPNKTIFCDEGYTCCEILHSGQEGCCMYYHGVCCKDQVHCCPQGEVCSTSPNGLSLCLSNQKDASSFMGVRGLGQLGAEETNDVTDMLRVSDVSLIHCGGESYCGDGMTCCKNGDGYMCCPYSQGSCCSDGRTCCKTWCVPYFNKCLPNSYQKVMATFEDAVDDDPSINTQAIRVVWCDADQSLYCPDGYTCNVQTSKCTKEQEVSIRLAKPLVPGKSFTKKTSDDIPKKSHKKDEQMIAFPQLEAALLPRFCSDPSAASTSQQCADGQLCCGAINQHMCCPYADGVCCGDGDTCCPSNTYCTASGMCKAVDSDIMIDQSKLTPTTHFSKESLSTQLSAVKEECPDKSECPEGTTCCILSYGQYACCQFSQATCCEDKLHCCPHGFTCDVAESLCKRTYDGEVKVSWELFTHKKASKVQKAILSDKSNICSSSKMPTHRCPSEYSCCNTASSNIVCCDKDSTCCGNFCCPSGYKCGGDGEKCVKV